jgi:hypothetical protein
MRGAAWMIDELATLRRLLGGARTRNQPEARAEIAYPHVGRGLLTTVLRPDADEHPITLSHTVAGTAIPTPPMLHVRQQPLIAVGRCSSRSPSVSDRAAARSIKLPST